MFDSMSDLTKHSQRHVAESLVHTVMRKMAFFCAERNLSRLRWWRLKKLRLILRDRFLIFMTSRSLCTRPIVTVLDLKILSNDGTNNFPRKSKKNPLCVILIRTSKGKILGAFTSGHLRKKHFWTLQSQDSTLYFFGYDEKLKDLSVSFLVWTS